MLQKLREHSTAWFAKLLFFILVVSFGSWGITDVLRNYSSTRSILSVGSFKVTLDEFMHRLHKEQNYVQNMTKGKATPEQMKQFRLGDRVIEELTTRGLISQEIGAENLVVTDATLTNTLHNTPSLQGEDGRFNPTYFRQLLQHNGISEAKFISDLRLSLLQNQLFQPFVQTLYLPKQYLTLLFKTLHQEHVFTIVEIPFEKVPSITPPKEAELKVFYNSNRNRFLRPETRTISLLFIDMNDIKNAVEIPESKLKEAYQERIQDFSISEKREVKELIVANNKVEKAIELLKSGKAMSAVAQELGGEARDMGWVSKNDLPEDMGKEVFSQTPPFIAEPVTTQFGSRITQILGVEPQSTKPYETVRTTLLESMKEQVANETSGDLRNKVEDSLAGGASPSDVAETFKLKLVKVESLTAQGKTPEGKSVLSSALSQDATQKILELTFTTPEGTDSPLTEIGNGNAFILHVDKVTPSHIPEFSDIQDTVSKEWYSDKRYEAAYEIAKELAKAKSPQELQQLAVKKDLKTFDTEPVHRITVDQGRGALHQLTPKLWHDMFGLSLHMATFGPVYKGFAVAMLVQINSADINKYPTYENKFKEKLLQQTAEDLRASFLNGLRQLYPVKVDTSMLAKATGQS